MLRILSAALVAAYLGFCAGALGQSATPTGPACRGLDDHIAATSATLDDAERGRLHVTVSTPEVADAYFALLDAVPNVDGSMDETVADAALVFVLPGAAQVLVYAVLDGLVCDRGWWVGLGDHLRLWALARHRAGQVGRGAEPRQAPGSRPSPGQARGPAV